MGLLERLVGPDAAREFRERVAAAAVARGQAARVAPSIRARPVAAMMATPTASPATPKRAPSGPIASAGPTAPAKPSVPGDPSTLAGPLELGDLAGGDFPTSILAAAAEPAPPLLSAFANRSALLAAVVFSEALAPPVALR